MIRQAEFPDDAEAVARLFGGYVDFLMERAPAELVAPILTKYPPGERMAAVQDFARLHVPPTGALLLAEVDETAVGCGMMRLLEPGIAELQRVFVEPAGRGRGLGRRIVVDLMERARALGAEIVRLDTGAPLVEAIALYRDLGFREVPPYHDDFPALQPHLVFFECRL